MPANRKDLRPIWIKRARHFLKGSYGCYRLLINFFDDIARLQSAVRIFINFCDDDPVNTIWNIQLTGDFRSQFANLNGIKWTTFSSLVVGHLWILRLRLLLSRSEARRRIIDRLFLDLGGHFDRFPAPKNFQLDFFVQPSLSNQRSQRRKIPDVMSIELADYVASLQLRFGGG